MPENLLEWVGLILSILSFVILITILLVILLRKSKTDSLDNKYEIINSVNNSINLLGSLLSNNNEQLSKQQMNTLSNSLKILHDSSSKSNLEIEQKLDNIRSSVEKSLSLSSNQTEIKLENIRSSVDKSINRLQEENTKKLDEIRNTVDEKLQKTLEDRISKSFQMVSERLEQVYKGLGEMQNLAIGVGDLKKVLSNVKTRGILGEIQLGNILEEILTPDQYDTNVVTKLGSNERVEFAVKLPGDNDTVYLPIDAKFPLTDFQNLLDAYENSNPEAVKISLNSLLKKIKSFAKDIRDKYIDVPNTTDFGIMFLPVEGLYAEVVKSGIVETLQRDYRINVAGPTTMAALLNSLQMGFKTLSIQKRSSEVWKILGAVKTEFSKFGKALEDTQSRLNQANENLEKLVGTRTRLIQSKLNKVTELPDIETKVLLPIEED